MSKMPRLFPSHWWWFGCKVQIEQDFSSFFPLLVVLIWCQFSICEILKKIIKLTNFLQKWRKKVLFNLPIKTNFLVASSRKPKIWFRILPDNTVVINSQTSAKVQLSSLSQSLLFELLELFFLSRTPSWSIKLI